MCPKQICRERLLAPRHVGGEHIGVVFDGEAANSVAPGKVVERFLIEVEVCVRLAKGKMQIRAVLR